LRRRSPGWPSGRSIGRSSPSRAFGNKETTLKRLRKGESNKSDLGGVLQTNNIHIAVASPGAVPETLAALRAGPATTQAKAKFILATDGEWLEAEDLVGGGTVACSYADFPDHFGFFLPLAGITTVQQISENAFDIRATRPERVVAPALLSPPASYGLRHDHAQDCLERRAIGWLTPPSD
jgi:hypothetical protein